MILSWKVTLWKRNHYKKISSRSHVNEMTIFGCNLLTRQKLFFVKFLIVLKTEQTSVLCICEPGSDRYDHF